MKKDLAMHIAKALFALHVRRKDTIRDSEQKFYTHKHLSSHNIMISGGTLQSQDYKVYLADMESEQLRKYARLFMNYNSINAWSPPELLMTDKQMNEIGVNTSMQSEKGFDYRKIDVYSFGMLLWEIETQQVPFEGRNENEIKDIIVEKSLRPQIPNFSDSNLTFLIRSCWQKQPEKRVDFEYICSFLDKVQFSSQ